MTRTIIPALLVAVAVGCHASHDRTGASISQPRCTGDPATDAVVDFFVSVDAASGGYTEVSLADGRTYLLGPEDEGFADIIESHGERHPVYLEYEVATGVIVYVGLTREHAVLTITASDVGVNLTLDHSHAIHPLERTLPCYDIYLGHLRAALEDGTTVWITHDSLYHVIDVRPAP
jgi:hypothetical protein